MRCTLCTVTIRGPRCVCGARADEEKHRELSSVFYLLGQITRWETEGAVPAETIRALRERYVARRDELKSDLRAVPEPVVPVASPVAPPVPVRVAPAPRVERVDPPAAPTPAAPRPSIRNLFTERNVGWLLTIGIGIFAVALAVFVATQWQSMGRGAQVGILFGGTLAVGAGGVALRRTKLSVTGTALVALAALALPIDFFAAYRLDLIGVSGPALGAAGSLVCLIAYVGLAALFAESWAAALALTAGASLYAFTLRLFGLTWEHAVALMPVLMAAYAEARAWLGSSERSALLREPLRWIPSVGFASALAATLALVIVGRLGLKDDFYWIQAALLATAVTARVTAHRTDRARYSCAAALLAGLIFTNMLHWLEVPGNHLAQWLETIGAAFSLAWIPVIKDRRRRHAAAYVAVGVAFAIAGIAWGMLMADASMRHRALAYPLALAGVQYLAIGAWSRRREAWFPGAVLAGCGLLAFLHCAPVAVQWYPLALAGYALLHVLAAGWWRGRNPRMRVAATLCAVAAGGLAFVLLAHRATGMYFPRMPWLGAASCAAIALSFVPLAHWERNRFLSDVAFGAIGFAIVFVLKACDVPLQWTGLAVTAMAAVYLATERWISRWLPRPTLVTAGLASIACLVLTAVQVAVGLRLEPGLTLLSVAALCLSVARFSPQRWAAHPGTYLAAFGLLLLTETERFWLPAHWRPFAVLAVPAAGLLWAWLEDRRQRTELALHLAAAAMVALLPVCAFAFLDVDQYARPALPATIAAATLIAALGAFFAFARPERVNVRVPATVMAFFASVAYLLFLAYHSTGSTWGPFVVLGGAAGLMGAAWALRSRFVRQAQSIGAVSILMAGAAVFSACGGAPADAGVYVWLTATALALYAAAAIAWRSPTMAAYAGALVLALSIAVTVRLDERTNWGPTIACAVPALAYAATAFARARLGRAGSIAQYVGASLGLLACAVAAVAWRRALPWNGVELLIPACVGYAAFELSRRAQLPKTCEGLAVAVMAIVSLLAGVAGAVNGPQWALAALAGAFALHYVAAERAGRAEYVVLACAFAALAEVQVLRWSGETVPGLAMIVPLALYGLGWVSRARQGERFAWILFGAAGLGSAFAALACLEHPTDLMLTMLAVSAMAGLASALLRSPWLMYVTGGALMAANVAGMFAAGLGATHVAVGALGLSLALSAAARTMKGRGDAYAKPLFESAIVGGTIALVWGLSMGREYVATQPQCAAAAVGSALAALMFVIAGRRERAAVVNALAAVHGAGAYYLALHWLKLGGTHVILEAYTAPVGAALALWSAVSKRRPPALVDGVAAAMLTAPSCALSFVPGYGWHALLLYGLALATVLAGMALRRRVYLIAGTGMMVVETAGKAVELLVNAGTSAAEWGMLVGAFIIVLAAIFESRKTTFVRDRLRSLSVGAQSYFREWS